MDKIEEELSEIAKLQLDIISLQEQVNYQRKVIEEKEKSYQNLNNKSKEKIQEIKSEYDNFKNRYINVTAKLTIELQEASEVIKRLQAMIKEAEEIGGYKF